MKTLDPLVLLKLGVFVVLSIALTVLAALKVISGTEAVDSIKALGMALIGGLAAFGGASKIAGAMNPPIDNKATMKIAAPFTRDSQRSTPPFGEAPAELPIVCGTCPYKETPK